MFNQCRYFVSPVVRYMRVLGTDKVPITDPTPQCALTLVGDPRRCPDCPLLGQLADLERSLAELKGRR